LTTGHFEKYDKIFVVGTDLKQREYDEGLDTFCKKHECDLVTADNTAYVHFLAEKIKTVQISELFYDEKADRPIYIVKIID
jgi:menaquinone-dependent protoporphyrinogen IX oxidase